MNRLQDRYNVRIQFPRSAPSVGDDRSVTDDASETGGNRNRISQQSLDEVVVRGPSRGADSARDELLSLLQWTIDNSHNSTVSVAQRQLPSLIGQGGQEMETVRLATGAQIDVPGRESVDPNGRVQIQIKGNKKQVDEAKKILEQRAKIFDATITRMINVDVSTPVRAFCPSSKFSTEQCALCVIIATRHCSIRSLANTDSVEYTSQGPHRQWR